MTTKNKYGLEYYDTRRDGCGLRQITFIDGWIDLEKLSGYGGYRPNPPQSKARRCLAKVVTWLHALGCVWPL